MLIPENLLIFSGNKHVLEIASMALDLSAASGNFRIPRVPNFRLKLRMGIHSGPAVGLVTGPNIPRYWYTET